MNTDIEYLDQQRMRFLKWYLIGFAIFMILMLIRHFFRTSGLNATPIGTAVLIGLILTLILQAVSMFQSGLLERDIQRDPILKAALNNELVQSITTKSWVAAYLGACGMTLFFAITWAFYPICDPVTISLTSIAAGAGASRFYFYFQYKMS
jgi:hypothetical protein